MSRSRRITESELKKLKDDLSDKVREANIDYCGASRNSYSQHFLEGRYQGLQEALYMLKQATEWPSVTKTELTADQMRERDDADAQQTWMDAHRREQ